MTNNDKRADEICARFSGMTFSDSDEPLEWLRRQITEALNAEPPAIEGDVVEAAYNAFTAQLRKEGWTSCHASYETAEKKAVSAAIEAAIDKAVAEERARWKASILPYAEHEHGCSRYEWDDHFMTAGECTCGLSAAIKAIEQGGGDA